MSANIELQLIAKIIETQDFLTVEKNRITEEYFSPEPRSVFQFIRNHFFSPQTYGCVPSWDIVRLQYPYFPYIASADKIPTLCEQLRIARIRSQVIQAADELYRKVDVDPRECLNILREKAATISNEHEVSEELIMADSHDRLMAEYQFISQNNGVTGIPWPWPILNEDTQGIHRSNFLVVFGRPKNGKTWIAIYIAACAYQFFHRRVLIVSMEMRPQDMERRAACCIASLDYGAVKKARLQPTSYQQYTDTLRQLRDSELQAKNPTSGHKPALLITGKPGGKGGGGIGSLKAKISEFAPDLVIVDGVYLMKDDRSKQRNMDWKVISNISRDMKETANELNVPIIGVTQANRTKGDPEDDDSADLSQLAYSDAIGQDCDLAIKVKQCKDPTTGEKEALLAFPGTREGELDGFYINFHPGADFSYKREYKAPLPGGKKKGGHSGGGSGGGPTAQPAPMPTFNPYRMNP